MKNLDANRLYLHCEECDCGWYDPSTANNPADSFLITENTKFKAATWDEIEQAGWQQYALMCELIR